MLMPLKQWICDTCGEIIESPEHGWLEWRQDENHKAFDFNIVHHIEHSPRKLGGGDCYPFKDLSSHLDRYVGEDGLPHLLCLLDEDIHINPVDGLQVPYYEEARQYFHRASQDGYFDGAWGSIFTPEKLKSIIEKYGTLPVSDL
jgi:hypothetical protein